MARRGSGRCLTPPLFPVVLACILLLPGDGGLGGYSLYHEVVEVLVSIVLVGNDVVGAFVIAVTVFVPRISSPM